MDNPQTLWQIIFVLVGVICALIGAHYISWIWEVRKLREEIGELKDAVAKSALAAAQAATTAAHVAHKLINGNNN